jgi:GDPmannose 4,6-dehydratase
MRKSLRFVTYRVGIRKDVQLASVALNDFRSVLQVLFKMRPDEVYNLAGQSSVSLSFEQPMETQESVYLGTLNLLEAIRFTGKEIKLYNASSSECFGDLEGKAATEETAFRPRSPYAVAKSAAFWQVSNYREPYKIFACSGILFDHESPLRPERFVTQKIVRSAYRIAQGKQSNLQLGNIEVQRDWGGLPNTWKQSI